MNIRCFQVLTIILVIASPIIVSAQQSPAPDSGEILTLDQAITLALNDNRQIQNAQLAIGKAEDQLAAVRTFQRPKFEFDVLAGQQLVPLDFTFTKGALGNYPNVGPIPNQDTKLSTPARPTAVFFGQITQPLSQLHRIHLNIKQASLAGDITREQLRGHQQSVVNDITRTYYAIVQTESGLDSVRQALAFYRELDRVTGDYVIQKVALKADDLEVKTRLAKTETEELTVSNQLSTLKEQLNQLIGRDIRSEFKIAPVPATSLLSTDLAAARALALEQRPEIREARLRVREAELDKRLKKSEYIPDISAAVTYVSPRNFDSFVPRNFAAAGVVMKWEIFDWGRKKNEMAERQKTIEQADNTLQDAESNVMIEVGTRMRNLKQSELALRAERLKQETARENVRVSMNKYKLQAALISEVLQTQAALADADYQYQQALTTFWTARAEYEKAIGEDK